MGDSADLYKEKMFFYSLLSLFCNLVMVFLPTGVMKTFENVLDKCAVNTSEIS